MHQRQQHFHLLPRALEQGFQPRDALVLVADNPVQGIHGVILKGKPAFQFRDPRQQFGDFRHALALPDACFRMR